MGYTIADYAAELRAIVARTDQESTILSQVRVAAAKLAANRDDIHGRALNGPLSTTFRRV